VLKVLNALGLKAVELGQVAKLRHLRVVLLKANLARVDWQLLLLSLRQLVDPSVFESARFYLLLGRNLVQFFEVVAIEGLIE